MSDGSRHLRLEEDSTKNDSQRAYYAKSWTLVVGINQYTGGIPPLVNACNDARAVAAILRNKYCFDEVHELYDEQATYKAMMSWLRDELPRRTAENDRVVFFFAGHGVTQDTRPQGKRGYLIPYDAEAGKYADYIDMRELLHACGAIPAKHIFIILDCCFSGVAAVAGRAIFAPSPSQMDDIYLRRITEKGAWQILTAGDSDDRVADGGLYPGHSIFTGVLLQGLGGAADHNGDNLFTATDLAAYVRPRVTRESAIDTGRSQTPFFNYLAYSAEGDFVFIVSPQTVPVVNHTIGFDWVTIPAGDFLMGSDKVKDANAQDGELPQHTVYLPEYRIARVPVTNAQYKQFIDATGYKSPRHWEDGQITSGKENHPVIRVSWHDALAFCKWAGVRLPTEAEWEKAASWDVRSKTKRIYPWGDTFDAQACNSQELGVKDTTDVEYYLDGASPYGVLDMVGNVWEWTSSLWGHDREKPDFGYPYNKNDGREDPNAAGLRVHRGGSWYGNDLYKRCACRGSVSPDYNSVLCGFRVVVSSSGS